MQKKIAPFYIVYLEAWKLKIEYLKAVNLKFGCKLLIGFMYKKVFCCIALGNSKVMEVGYQNFG